MKRALLLFAMLALPAAAHARPRIARCVIATEEAPYRGPCRFVPDRGASFGLEPVRGRRFFGEIGSISVAVIKPGEAEVSGLTGAGINSRWGSARRSRRDPACWEGQDFSVCAYQR
ncbi:MAG: hypothetical protein JWO81_44 [Alphaproteobacteria bacterium]|nr:hypothetical protein [Alphaproteobacteria bacterium]